MSERLCGCGRVGKDTRFCVYFRRASWANRLGGVPAAPKHVLFPVSHRPRSQVCRDVDIVAAAKVDLLIGHTGRLARRRLRIHRR